MITRIRDVRKARGMTLDEVGRRCDPPTTAQTIGRLETGMRTVSVGWLNRIAAALGVATADLIDLPGQESISVAALLGPDGARAPAKPLSFAAPGVTSPMVGIRVSASVGDYRNGDEIWCEKRASDAFASALNRDILLPRPAGRFLFGRLIGREGGRLHILPPGGGSRQQVISDPPWAAVAVRLIRQL